MTTSTKQTLTATEDSDAWLRRFHGDHGDRTRLFCFPHVIDIISTALSADHS